MTNAAASDVATLAVSLAAKSGIALRETSALYSHFIKLAQAKLDKKARNRRNGQYTFTVERLCKCGRPLGTHYAEAPHAFGEADGGPDCDRFRPAK